MGKIGEGDWVVFRKIALREKLGGHQEREGIRSDKSPECPKLLDGSFYFRWQKTSLPGGTTAPTGGVVSLWESFEERALRVGGWNLELKESENCQQFCALGEGWGVYTKQGVPRNARSP